MYDGGVFLLLDVKDECLRMAWNTTGAFIGPIRELKPRL